MEQELRQLLDAANRSMVQLGVRVRTFELNGHMVAQAYLPTQPRPLVITARVALPSDIVGGKLGKKVKAKVKTVAKKIAKSKVLGAVAKVAAGMAKAALPGGNAIAAAAAAIGVAKKLKKAAQHGTPKQKVAAKLVAKAATKSIQRARANAAPVAPGYPEARASRAPDNRFPELPGGNGYGDTPQEDVEQAMDPDQGSPNGELDIESDVEMSDDESADYESADYDAAAE
jgi:hypothetical protein